MAAGAAKGLNPCKCGWLGHPRRGCKCTPTELLEHAARARQRAGGVLNSLLPNPAPGEHCALDTAGQRLVADAVDRGGMSVRGVHRAIRVGRTIADLAGEERITPMGLAEALQYRAYEVRRFVAR
ncbi:MAG: hypothetical protein AAB290_05820 [Candidatus Eisenbacteria bacterium]